ncbi:MAG: hypothetical protein LWW85_12780 [Marinilabiliales bacterium]|nr:hypothetical protein [Marinilabiliales bacterium]
MFEKDPSFPFHRFLDEAGDTTVYGKGKKDVVGCEGVSHCFIIGMVKFREPLEPLRRKIIDLQNSIARDPYFNVASIQKKVSGAGYYLHATDDLPEVRKIFFDFIKQIDCSFEAVVATKSMVKFETKYHLKEEYLYADILSHLLKNKLMLKEERLVLNISARGKSTKNHNLELALAKAKQRFESTHDGVSMKTRIVFNITYPTIEPLLNVADYFCWAIQRVFERGETRFYDFLKEKISLVIDLHDKEKYNKFKNYYGPKNPLTAANKKSPPMH